MRDVSLPLRDEQFARSEMLQRAPSCSAVCPLGADRGRLSMQIQQKVTLRLLAGVLGMNAYALGPLRIGE